MTLAKPCNFIKNRLWHRCFPVNFAEFLRITFLTEHLRWLLLVLAIPLDIAFLLLQIPASEK